MEWSRPAYGGPSGPPTHNPRLVYAPDHGYAICHETENEQTGNWDVRWYGAWVDTSDTNSIIHSARARARCVRSGERPYPAYVGRH